MIWTLGTCFAFWLGWLVRGWTEAENRRRERHVPEHPVMRPTQPSLRIVQPPPFDQDNDDNRKRWAE